MRMSEIEPIISDQFVKQGHRRLTLGLVPVRIDRGRLRFGSCQLLAIADTDGYVWIGCSTSKLGSFETLRREDGNLKHTNRRV